MNLLELLKNVIINNDNKGADDTVPIMASEGEYVIPANIVALLGDGNSNAGAEILDEFVKSLDGVSLEKGQKLMDILGQKQQEE